MHGKQEGNAISLKKLCDTCSTFMNARMSIVRERKSACTHNSSLLSRHDHDRPKCYVQFESADVKDGWIERQIDRGRGVTRSNRRREGGRVRTCTRTAMVLSVRILISSVTRMCFFKASTSSEGGSLMLSILKLLQFPDLPPVGQKASTDARMHQSARKHARMYQSVFKVSSSLQMKNLRTRRHHGSNLAARIAL